MTWRLFRRRIQDVNGLFNAHFIDVQAYYIMEFDRIPCVSFIGELDATKAYAFIKERYEMQTRDIYQHVYFDHDKQETLFNTTIFVLQRTRMIEITGNYCQVLHRTDQYGWAQCIVMELSQFRKEADPVIERNVIGFARQNILE